MRKIILLSVLAVVIGLFVLTLVQRHEKAQRQEVTAWVMTDIAQRLLEQPETKNIEVSNAYLIKSGSGKYTGYVEYTYKGVKRREEVTATLHAGEGMYNTKPPADLVYQSTYDYMTSM